MFATDRIAQELFSVTPCNTPKSAGDYSRIISEKPDVILVDYNLDMPDENHNVIGISGVTLSTELRQRLPEVPIVLFTRRNVFNMEDYFNRKQDTLSSIDKIVYKQDLFKADSSALNELHALSEGYRSLRAARRRDWKKLVDLLGATTHDSDLLDKANITQFLPLSAVISTLTFNVAFCGVWVSVLKLTLGSCNESLDK